MLYFKIDGQAVGWNGEHIADIRYSSNIELLWSDAELAAIGLFRPLPADPLPDGKMSVGETVQIVGGAVKFVLELQDIPPTPEPEPEPEPPPNVPASFPLSNRQLRLGLIRNGIGLASVAAVIAAIPDDVARDEATVWWEYSDPIHWDHPMTQTLIGLMGIPLANAEAMWMAAKDYDA